MDELDDFSRVVSAGRIQTCDFALAAVADLQGLCIYVTQGTWKTGSFVVVPAERGRVLAFW